MGWLRMAADPQVCVLEEVALQPLQWEGLRTGQLCRPRPLSSLPPTVRTGTSVTSLEHGDHPAQHCCALKQGLHLSLCPSAEHRGSPSWDLKDEQEFLTRTVDERRSRQKALQEQRHGDPEKSDT